jgi:hypothetical protein
MMITGKRKNALEMGILWVAAVAVIALLTPKGEMTVIAWIWIPITFIMAILGLVIYLGHYMFISGFNTMTEKELAVYDMDKITTFMGLSLVILSFIFFLIWPLMEIYGFGAFAVMTIIIFIFGVILMAAYTNSKRFKKSAYAK